MTRRPMGGAEKRDDSHTARIGDLVSKRTIPVFKCSYIQIVLKSTNIYFYSTCALKMRKKLDREKDTRPFIPLTAAGVSIAVFPALVRIRHHINNTSKGNAFTPSTMPTSRKKAPSTVGDPTDPGGTLRPDEPPSTNEKQPNFDRLNIPKRTGGPRLPVDEAICAFTGRAKEKVKIPSKPIPEGFKRWTLAEEGYFISWAWHVKGSGPLCPRENALNPGTIWQRRAYQGPIYPSAG